MGLIDALVALVVFSLGMMALAELYVRAAPAAYQNTRTTAVQMTADSLFGVLQANPSALPIQVTNITAASAMPTALQGWFAQAVQTMPGLSVTIVSQPDALGNACTPASCGIQLSLSWSQLAETRTQVFHGQVGIH